MIHTDMTAGELSPRLKGRFDLEVYQKGVLEATNVLPFIQGGLTTRPGLMRQAEIGTSKVRLVPFIISESLSYILEFGATTLRFWKNGALLEDESGPLELTTPYTDPWSIQFAQDTASLYIASRTAPVKVLAMISDGVFTFENLAITSNTGMVPFQGTGNYPRAIAVFDGRMFFAGTDLEPQAIWASEPYDYGNITYYDTIESTYKQMREPMNPFTGTRTEGSATITGVSAEDLAAMRVGDTVFGTGIPYIYPDTITRIQEIGGNYIVLDREATSNGTDGMYTGWYDRGVTDWETVTSTRDVITAANAFKKTLACETNETILWLAAGTDLIVGTNTGERVIPSGVNAHDFICKKQTAHGAAPVQPLMLNDAIVFVGPTRSSIREYVFRGISTEAQAYSALRLDYIADHILTNITQIDYSVTGLPFLWLCQSSGELIALARDRNIGVSAFSRFTVTGATIESVAVIPEDGEDRIYLSVNREGTRTLQKMELLWSGKHLDDAQEKTVVLGQVDASWISGMAVVVANGEAQTLEVIDGLVTPEGLADGETVLVGRPFTSRIRTMPTIENPMKRKNIPVVTVKVYESYPFSVGYQGALADAVFTGPYSGDVDVSIAGGWDNEGIIVIEQQALPLTVLALAYTVSKGG